MCEHGAHALVEEDGVEQKRKKNKKFVLVANELLCEHGARALVEADGVKQKRIKKRIRNRNSYL